ncbi:MAG: DEAD/DEAH box helicase [Candidatus Nanoarchaeia archaeon]|nr:DEAD/DEAH box helicase [Candidatus Nanoarchaeia archaeon]MDD5238913.1 DEAD/DEAH box helicase [Candidatus Nanoarchaeia archaeon]
MNIEELEKFGISMKIVELFKEERILRLNPPQQKAIQTGLFDGKDIVVASPTSSGKSMIMTLAFIKNLLSEGGKAIYISPLKALASEKYEYYKNLFKEYPLKVAISTGDFDSFDRGLANNNILILTVEKLDSLIRHNIPWLNEIKVIIIDEIHLLDDANRGPTLEVLITRLKNFCPKAQLIALSATISNADEIAKWLGAELVKSDYRPVELHEGVYINGELDFGGKIEKLKGKSDVPEIRILEDTLAKNKSMLLFVSSRRNAEGCAKKCADTVAASLNAEEKKELEALSKEILDVLETPTKQCEDLAECVKSGVAFHHAGLVAKQRSLIENAFRSRLIKIICCTPTLAAGLNLPAFRAVVRDLKRFDSEEGMGFIPVLEFKQMCGRAGRPGLDDSGQGIAIAKTVKEAEEIREKYIKGIPEDVYSKLSVEPVLRMQILGLISTGEIIDRKSLMGFFAKTFYAVQYKNLDRIENNLDKIMNELIGWGFIKPEGQKLLPTLIGKRVAELYIDPYSAHKIMEALKKSNQEPLYYIHTICSCVEMRPLLYISSKDFSELQQKSLKFDDVLPEAPSAWDVDYEVWFRAIKTAFMLNDWIGEKNEAQLFDEYHETPGMLKNRLNNADWMLYSMGEIAGLLKRKEDLTPLRKLRIRMKYGAKEELLNLLRFEGIGRIRARKLYFSGIKSVVDVKKIAYEKLSDLIGPKIAKKLKDQVVSEEQQNLGQ